MTDDILIKWFKNLVSFVEGNPITTLVIVIFVAVSIYCLYKLVDKLRYG